MLFTMFDKAMFSIVAMVIHIDVAISETTQPACCWNQHIFVV